MMTTRFILSALLTLIVGMTDVRAQTELEQARRSLRGLGAFYVAVNVEGPQQVTAREVLDVRRLTRSVEEQLRTAGLVLVHAERDRDPERMPHLHVHINVLDGGRGLYPFTVEVEFLQPVYLMRDRSISTVASTWESSLVGLVTHDQLHVIAEAASNTVGEFITDAVQTDL